MPVPGYDPEDLDDILETKIDRQQKREYLTDEEWAAYRDGDASLVDLLDDEEIHALLDRDEEGTEIPTGD